FDSARMEVYSRDEEQRGYRTEGMQLHGLRKVSARPPFSLSLSPPPQRLLFSPRFVALVCGGLTLPDQKDKLRGDIYENNNREAANYSELHCSGIDRLVCRSGK